MIHIKRLLRFSRMKAAFHITVAAVFGVVSLGMPPAVFGITESAIKSLNAQHGWYDPKTECSAEGGATGASSAMAGLSITGTSSVISGDPLTLKNPVITDPVKYGEAMVNFIKKASPNSPWLDIPDLATKLVNEGQQRDVNMMIIVSVGRQESGIGTSNVAKRNNNSFGNKGNGPGGYRAWPSFEASLIGEDSFTKHFTERQAGGDHKSYAKVTNLYEFLSVHVSGQIIYPGDKTTSYDDIMGESIDDSAVVRYFTNVSGWIGEMTGYTIKGVPQKGGGATTPVAFSGDVALDAPCATQASNDGGVSTVSLDNYFWPVAPIEQRQWGDAPCRKKAGCHWDSGKAAFDLYFGKNEDMDGRDVFAITDGTIANIDRYNGKQGCYDLQLESSKAMGGRFFWYGHLQEPKVTKNQPVKGGVKIAEVGRTELTSQCWLGRTHLHIDMGCMRNGKPQWGGSDPCRDPALVPIIDGLWDKLPKAVQT